MLTSRRLYLVAACLVVAAVCAAYAPHVGRGFKQDDFGWVAGSRARQASDWVALFGRNTGFYRPAVAVTFALDEQAFRMNALGYGLTNLALLVACLLAIASLGRSLGLTRGAALAAGACWALNTQGINMAVVWISGRTALVLVLFAALAARALARGQVLRTALFAFLALLSKEEAVMLPLLLFVWAGLQNVGPKPRNPSFPLRQAAAATWPLAISLAAYFVLRHVSGAFTPLSAPPYYRLTAEPAHLADNAIKYLDFAATFPAAVVVLGALLTAVLPRPSAHERRVVLLGGIWLAAGYAVTMFVPIRSPLYACFPAVGTSLAAAALLQSAWKHATAPGRWRMAVAGLVLPFMLLPMYWARNARHAKGAELSAQLLRDLERARPDIPEGAVVVLRDDPRLPVTDRIPAAFGTLYEIAVRDTLGRPTQSWLDPPPEGWHAPPPDPAAAKVVFRLKDGHLVKVDSSQ